MPVKDKAHHAGIYAKLLKCEEPLYTDHKKWRKVRVVMDDMIASLEDALEAQGRHSVKDYLESEAEEGEEESGDETEKKQSLAPNNTRITSFFEKKYEDKEADLTKMKTGVDEIDLDYEDSIKMSDATSLKQAIKKFKSLGKCVQAFCKKMSSKAEGPAKQTKSEKKKRKRDEEEALEFEMDDQDEAAEELRMLSNDIEGEEPIYYDESLSDSQDDLSVISDSEKEEDDLDGEQSKFVNV